MNKVTRRAFIQGLGTLAAAATVPSVALATKPRTIAVAVDVSGSIDIAFVENALREIANTARDLEADEVRVVYFDTQVQREDVLTVDELAVHTLRNVPGGGGGMFDCVPKHFEANNIQPDAVIVITDGWIWGIESATWTCPTLWTILDGPGCHAAAANVSLCLKGLPAEHTIRVLS